MALIMNQYCNYCHAEVAHINGKCKNCSTREYRESIAAWQAKTVEEKLLDLHLRLQRLEAGPTRY